MSQKESDEPALLFDLYNWKHVSDESSYVWKKDGHTVEAEYVPEEEQLNVTYRPENGDVETFPAIPGFQPRNDDAIRRQVEDMLAGAHGAW